MPVLSGFLPIPLAMMIPFMGAQSLVLGKQFGEGFQYGKRKISAMSNEEFNKITPQKLAQDNANELRQMIPSMKQSIQDMRDFQTFIVRELIETAKQLPNDIFGAGSGFDVARANETAVKEGFGLNLLPQAFAEESNTTLKFASDYELEAMALPFKLLSDIAQKMLSGKLTKPIERRIGYLNAYKKRLPEKKDKPTNQQIQDKISETSTGVTKQIAFLFQNINQAMLNWKHRPTYQTENKLVIAIKTFNRFVQKNGKPKLTIDVAKTIKAKKIQI